MPTSTDAGQCELVRRAAVTQNAANIGHGALKQRDAAPMLTNAGQCQLVHSVVTQSTANVDHFDAMTDSFSILVRSTVI